MYSVGLTGGIGSGKTTVARLLAAHGVPIIDTDQIARRITAPGGVAINAIRSVFGATYLTAEGALNRARMRSLVFTHAQALARLEAIMHPLIRAECEREAATATGPYLIFVVPLLLESAIWRARVKRILVIDCSEETQITRVTQRSGLTRKQALSIIRKQVPRSERLAAADDILSNDDAQNPLSEAVANLHAHYLTLAAAASPNRLALTLKKHPDQESALRYNQLQH
jgi:dephospho-CoA kinase